MESLEQLENSSVIQNEVLLVNDVNTTYILEELATIQEYQQTLIYQQELTNTVLLFAFGCGVSVFVLLLLYRFIKIFM